MLADFHQPVFDLARVLEFAAWHRCLLLSLRSLKRLAQLAPFVGIHHLRVADHAAEPRSEICSPVPVLRFEPFVLRTMENGAETFEQMTREVRATVNHDAGHRL